MRGKADAEKLIECNACGWVHFKVSEGYVQAWEKDWHHCFETWPKERLASHGITDKPPTRERFLACARCGNKELDKFFESKKSLPGQTIQPILWQKDAGESEGKMNEQDKTYLGDSVYVSHDGYQLRLTTENGYGPSNEIFLEPHLVDTLVEYLKRITAKYADASEEKC